MIQTVATLIVAAMIIGGVAVGTAFYAVIDYVRQPRYRNRSVTVKELFK